MVKPGILKYGSSSRGTLLNAYQPSATRHRNATSVNW